MLLRIVALLAALICLPSLAGAQGAVSQETVAEIQSMLSQLGYQPGAADGVMGERTRDAIRRYQAGARLAVDGEPSVPLRDALRIATGRDPAASGATQRPVAWTGSATRSLTLHQQPAAASATARVLAPGTALDAYRRQGEWLEIRTRDGKALQGWVLYSGVRRMEQAASPVSPGSAQGSSAPAAAAESGGFFSNLARGVTKLLGGSGPAPRPQGTVTVGVRGLAAEDLAAARPDPAELAKMESHRASRDQAYQLASQARLAARTVDYLPAAASSAGGSTPAASGGGRD